MSESWYVVQTQPRAEERACRHLANQGFRAYLPRYRRRVRHARKSFDVLRPLFPGYLFVRFDPELCRWRSINGTVGVCCILADGDVPRDLDDAVVKQIMQREDETGVVKLERPTFVPGQAVRVTEGPFADLEALFEDERDDERVVLLITLLGRKVRAQIPALVVEAA